MRSCFVFDLPNIRLLFSARGMYVEYTCVISLSLSFFFSFCSRSSSSWLPRLRNIDDLELARSKRYTIDCILEVCRFVSPRCVSLLRSPPSPSPPPPSILVLSLVRESCRRLRIFSSRLDGETHVNVRIDLEIFRARNFFTIARFYISGRVESSHENEPSLGRLISCG